MNLPTPSCPPPHHSVQPGVCRVPAHPLMPPPPPALCRPVRAVYLSLCVFLDIMYANRPIQRFWFLETVARMPYFSYITMLHLYESLGWWRAGA